jgi:hypothetical protein
MDAKEPYGVQLSFKIGYRLVDAVFAPIYDGIGEFVAGNEMRDCV